MICRNCDSIHPEGTRTCLKCGSSLRPVSQFHITGEVAALDPAFDAAIKPALAARLEEWSVPASQARLSVHLKGRNYPLGRISHLRALLDDGLIRPETPVLHQKRGRWFEAHKFPGVVISRGRHIDDTGQFDDKTPEFVADNVATVEGRAVLAARLGREAEEAAASGDIVRAIDIYEEVVEINPRYPLVKRRLRQLRAALEEGVVEEPIVSGIKPARLPSRDLLDEPKEETVALSLADEPIRDRELALDDSTSQEEVLEPTAFVLLHGDSTSQELVFEDTPVESFRCLDSLGNAEWPVLADLYASSDDTPLATMGVEVLQRAFEACHSASFLFDADTLIGALRVISDGQTIATLCDLVLAPTERRSAAVEALVFHALQELDIPRCILVIPVQFEDVLASLPIDEMPSVSLHCLGDGDTR